jgi:hypothetical protein
MSGSTATGPPSSVNSASSGLVKTVGASLTGVIVIVRKAGGLPMSPSSAMNRTVLEVSGLSPTCRNRTERRAVC